MKPTIGTSRASSLEVKRSDDATERPTPTALMREYFELKDEGKLVRAMRSSFMETYRCLTPYSDDEFEQPTDCISWINYEPRRRGLKLCKPCTRRHSFYLRLKDMRHRRGAIMVRVRHLVKAEQVGRSET